MDFFEYYDPYIQHGIEVGEIAIKWVFSLNMVVSGCIGMDMQNNAALHEKLHREETAKVGPDRVFGLLFSFIFAIAGLYPLWNGEAVMVWPLAVAGGFACIALAAPFMLRPFNIVWCHFGRLLHIVMTPLIMGLIFFLVFTPLSLVSRMVGRDALSCRIDPEAKTYWIDRPSNGPASETMRNQF